VFGKTEREERKLIVDSIKEEAVNLLAVTR